MTHAVARRLVKRGHEVTWLASEVADRPAQELIDGVAMIRRGTEATTRLYAPSVVRRSRPDVVLEEINTLPYLAPLWTRVPVLLFMHQLARDVWWYEAPLPLSAIGWAIEPLYLRAYRGCEAITVSRSSRDDLRRVGVTKSITVAPQTVDVERASVLGSKQLVGSMLAIGRLTPSKRYDHTVEALRELRLSHPSATLALIGEGSEGRRLQEMADRAGIAGALRLLGGVSEAEKIAALDAVDVVVGTSVREGWGLTVTEAAARGTPAVVYDIPGFRDSVVPDRTGLLVEPRPTALASAVATLVDDAPRYERLRTEAWKSVAGMDHESTVDAFESALESAVSRKGGGSASSPRAVARRAG